jgi:2-polyprenyl-3-methyl-5-hydroxy-6-metoxy-1,4-benzoquinol methylase
MDAKTIEAYNKHGKAFSKRYRSGQRLPMERLKAAFSKGKRILEVGAGSGIDAAGLLSEGFDITAIEPSALFIEEALEHFPQLKGRILQLALPLDEATKADWKDRFDGILCSAVFMHITTQLRQQAMQDLACILKPAGQLMLSISTFRNGLDDDNRDEFGRLYIPMLDEETRQLIDATGFQIITQWDDDDQWHRRGLNWKSYQLEKQ